MPAAESDGLQPHLRETLCMGRLRVFVMTDVVGSTKLWDEHPEAMPEALARHDHLIQSAMTAHDGTVFKHTGDGMIAAFDAAEAAVSASLAAVAALADADWPTTGPLRIRCSIHAGAATERDGDFFGSPINRLARINGLAQPDQVLGPTPSTRCSTGLGVSISAKRPSVMSPAQFASGSSTTATTRRCGHSAGRGRRSPRCRPSSSAAGTN